MDEVDRVFLHDNHRDDFFALIRYWHDGRARDPQLALLNLVLAYRTETSLFIQNLSQSPFTVGQVFELADFTKPQFEYLNFKHGSPVKKAAENDTLMRLLADIRRYPKHSSPTQNTSQTLTYNSCRIASPGGQMELSAATRRRCSPCTAGSFGGPVFRTKLWTRCGPR